MITASVIIVTFNAADTIEACLTSLANQSSDDFEVIVVDNDSSDATIGKLKFKDRDRFLVVASKQNLGFSGGNRLGFQKSRGKTLIFLNPDATVPKDFVTEMTTSAGHQDRGVVGCNIEYPSGELQMGGSTFPTLRSLLYDGSNYRQFFPNSRSFKRFIISNWDRLSPRFIDAVPGAAFAIRRQVLDDVGGFDPHYFLFYEEYDLGRALKRLGMRAYLDTSIRITHITHAATDKVAPAEIGRILSQSRDYYIRKHHGPVYLAIFKLLCRGFDLAWRIRPRFG